MPQKHTLNTSIIQHAWLDDRLIADRKRGLALYINSLIGDYKFREHSALLDFLSPDVIVDPALPQMVAKESLTLTKGIDENNVKAIAASYYPAWSTDTVPPNKIDFSKFDLLFFGKL